MAVQTVEVVVRRSNADTMVTKVIVGLQARAAVARDPVDDSLLVKVSNHRRRPIVSETSCFWASNPIRCGYHSARGPLMRGY